MNATTRFSARACSCWIWARNISITAQTSAARFPISGKFTAEERYYYEAVLKAGEAILQALKPGYPIDDTLELARDTMYPFTAGEAEPQRTVPTW